MPGPVIVGDDERERSRDALVLGSWLASLLGAEVEIEHIAQGSPADGLVKAAEAADASAIVVGSSHRGRIGRVFPGSTAVRVLHATSTPVAIASRAFADATPESPRVIAVAFDGTPESRRALEFAAQLADPERAALRVITVYPGFATGQATDIPSLKGQLKDKLHETVNSLPPELRAEARFRMGAIPATLIAESELGVDLLVMGSRGLSPRGAAFLGSVSQQVTEAAACPVVIVPRAETAQYAESGNDGREG